MTLEELMDALDELIKQGVEGDEPICADVNGVSGELTGITVVVSSDTWEPGTVVASVDLFDEGEADDG